MLCQKSRGELSLFPRRVGSLSLPFLRVFPPASFVNTSSDRFTTGGFLSLWRSKEGPPEVDEINGANGRKTWRSLGRNVSRLKGLSNVWRFDQEGRVDADVDRVPGRERRSADAVGYVRVLVGIFWKSLRFSQTPLDGVEC